MKYNYLEAVKEDVKEFIRTEIDFHEWNGNREGLEEYLNDTLWTEDSVTGNASGSYTFNTWSRIDSQTAEFATLAYIDAMQRSVIF